MNFNLLVCSDFSPVSFFLLLPLCSVNFNVKSWRVWNEIRYSKSVAPEPVALLFLVFQLNFYSCSFAGLWVITCWYSPVHTSRVYQIDVWWLRFKLFGKRNEWKRWRKTSRRRRVLLRRGPKRDGWFVDDDTIYPPTASKIEPKFIFAFHLFFFFSFTDRKEHHKLTWMLFNKRKKREEFRNSAIITNRSPHIAASITAWIW